MTEVRAHITGTVWKVEKKSGDEVKQGEAIVILESMKMEIPVESPAEGKVKDIKISEGQPVKEGDVLAIVE